MRYKVFLYIVLDKADIFSEANFAQGCNRYNFEKQDLVIIYKYFAKLAFP